MVKTISILEETHKLLREEYVKSGRTIKSIVHEAVQEYVEKRVKKAKEPQTASVNIKEW